MATQKDQSTDNAGVRVPPPMIWLILQLIGLAIDSAWFRLQLAGAAAMIVGALIFALALYVAVASIPRHKKGGSNIEPWKPTTAIFTDGIYGRSRNPIYLSMLIGFAGIAIAAGSLASVALLAVFWAILQFYVIAREERYLEFKFGQQYSDYRNTVRRWI
jgi:protein-S-isoprenylcysteine O-methyltransferase Ste14